MNNADNSILHEDLIINKIHFIRGQKVMLDKDLAEIYGVETKRLKEQVKRNIERFTSHYMFELSKEETEISRSQIATLIRNFLVFSIQKFKEAEFLLELTNLLAVTSSFNKLRTRVRGKSVLRSSSFMSSRLPLRLRSV
jgi:hypothetical protein